MQFVVLLIAVALVVKYWWVIVAVCFVGWLIWSLVSGYRRARRRVASACGSAAGVALDG
jgi:hypothetical protein